MNTDGTTDVTIIGAAVCTFVHGRARLFVGSATGDVRQVQIAVESAVPVAPAPRAKPQCRALAGAGGRLLLTPATNGVCNQVQWLTVTGTTQWQLRLASSLPPGRYVLYVRPVMSIGSPVTGFAPSRHNRLAFTVL